jgi:hypothetical protein
MARVIHFHHGDLQGFGDFRIRDWSVSASHLPPSYNASVDLKERRRVLGSNEWRMYLYLITAHFQAWSMEYGVSTNTQQLTTNVNIHTAAGYD